MLAGDFGDMSKIVDAIAADYAGKLKVGKVKNLKENPAITGRYTITSIPTLLLFKDGKVIEKRKGT